MFACNLEPLLAQIYPGAKIELDKNIEEIDGFVVNDSTITIYTKSQHHLDISLSDPSILLSDPHPTLIDVYTTLSSDLWGMFFDFMREDFPYRKMDLVEFERCVILQMQNYEYYFSPDPDILITKISSFFSVRIPHDSYCHFEENDPPFENHSCSPGIHFYYLLMSIYDKSDQYQITINSCLGLAYARPNGMYYFHITPSGSMIIAQNYTGEILSFPSGIDDHPLTRMLFWRILLQKRPDLRFLFENAYLKSLNQDLLSRGLIHTPCSCISEMIEQYNTQLCIVCSKPGSYRFYNIRSFSIVTIRCNHHDYDYLLVFLAVLKNGWDKYKTYLNYMDQRIKIVYRNSDLKFGITDFTGICRSGFCHFLNDEKIPYDLY